MPYDVIIRPAVADDLQRLGQLRLRSSLAWGEHAAELQALPEASEVPAEHLPFLFVADHQGEPVGFATVLPSAGEDAELEDLFVDPSVWGDSVGTRLAQEAERRALALGFRGLHVVASRRAEPFYQAMGFRTVGVVETLFEAAPAMRKDIA